MSIFINLGALFSIKDVRDYKLAISKSQKVVIYDKEFELPMPKVKNQKNVASCVAHSIATVIEYFNIQQNNDTCKMSVGYIYGNRKNTLYKGKGMYVREALANTCKYGDVRHDSFPYNEEVPEIISKFEESHDELDKLGKGYVITKYYKLKNIDEIKFSLVNNGPVVFAMYWYDDIKLKDNILVTDHKKSKDTGGHAMVIYGWNEDGWKVQNSWGTSFGNKGRFILPYDVKITEAWGVIDTSINTEIELKKPFNSKIGKIIATIINYILKIMKIKG